MIFVRIVFDNLCHVNIYVAINDGQLLTLNVMYCMHCIVYNGSHPMLIVRAQKLLGGVCNFRLIRC